MKSLDLACVTAKMLKPKSKHQGRKTSLIEQQINENSSRDSQMCNGQALYQLQSSLPVLQTVHATSNDIISYDSSYRAYRRKIALFKTADVFMPIVFCGINALKNDRSHRLVFVASQVW